MVSFFKLFTATDSFFNCFDNLISLVIAVGIHLAVKLEQNSPPSSLISETAARGLVSGKLKR